jgi:hypothetical protein
MTLADLIPDVDLLLRLPPELVGKQLLKLASKHLQNGSFAIGAITGRDYLFGDGYSPARGQIYPQQKADEIELAVGEAWHWLENAMLIMPEAAPNASFKRLTRRGKALVKDGSRFESFVAAAAFPKSLLHPLILDEVWLQLAQGKLDVAVFIAFKAVEEAVRSAAGYPVSEHGVPMMRKAFHKDTGPLRRPDDPDAEKEALSNLFAGAIGRIPIERLDYQMRARLRKWLCSHHTFFVSLMRARLSPLEHPHSLP